MAENKRQCDTTENIPSSSELTEDIDKCRLGETTNDDETDTDAERRRYVEEQSEYELLCSEDEYNGTGVDECDIECNEKQDLGEIEECERMGNNEDDILRTRERIVYGERSNRGKGEYRGGDNDERIQSNASSKGLGPTKFLSVRDTRENISRMEHGQQRRRASKRDRRGRGEEPAEPEAKRARDERVGGGECSKGREELASNKEDKQSKKVDENYYTSIVHTNDIKYPKGRATACIVANHGDHVHIVWRSSTGNSNRTRKQINTNFEFNSGEIAECVTTTQKVRDIRYFVRYLIRYGIQSITYINGGIREVNDIIENTQADENVNCMEMWQKREVRREESDGKKVNFIKHKKDAYDYIKELIVKYKCKSVHEFNRMISPEEFEMIMVSYGPSTYNTHVRVILKYENAKKLKGQQSRPFMQHVTYDSSINTEIQEEYIKLLFDENKINFSYFCAWMIIVMDKHIHKVNTLILSGNPNTGKSMLLNLFTNGLVKAFVTRTGDATQFHLQNCLDKRILLFEEPRITPVSVDDMKLLLGGEIFDIQIKHSDPENLIRTPVLVSTNKALGYHLSPIDSNALDVRSREFMFIKVIGTHIDICEETITSSAVVNLILKNVIDIKHNFIDILMRRLKFDELRAQSVWEDDVESFFK